MALTKDDLKAIEKIIEKQLKPIERRLAAIEKSVEKIEHWIPTDNTYLVRPIKAKDAQKASRV